MMRTLVATAIVAALASRLAADATVRAPAPATWSDRCAEKERRAAAPLGLRGPIYAWRERATEWGAQQYDTFLEACARDPKLLAGLDQPPLGAHGEGDGLIFAVGPSMQFRVVLIPIDCSPRAARSESWFDKQKYWDPDEWDAQSHGVSATIHADPKQRELGKKFYELLRPAVDACLADRPFVAPAKECSPVPG